MKQKIWFSNISFIVLVLLFSTSCSKDDGNNNNPNGISVTTNNMISIRSYTAKASLTITSLSTFVDGGICWGTSRLPDRTNNTIDLPNASKEYVLKNLIPNTTYYVRAYAATNGTVIYGNEVSFVTKPLTLALKEDFGGGTIFYIDPSGIHGLIAAPFDIERSRPWVSVGSPTSFTTGSGLNTGKTNTSIIVGAYGLTGDYAALMCKNQNINGFNDWFLPSKDEINLIRTNLFQNGIGDFDGTGFYWSSTTDNVPSAFAWRQNFNTGSQTLSSGVLAWSILPCRAF